MSAVRPSNEHGVFLLPETSHKGTLTQKTVNEMKKKKNLGRHKRFIYRAFPRHKKTCQSTGKPSSKVSVISQDALRDDEQCFNKKMGLVKHYRELIKSTDNAFTSAGEEPYQSLERNTESMVMPKIEEHNVIPAQVRHDCLYVCCVTAWILFLTWVHVCESRKILLPRLHVSRE